MKRFSSEASDRSKLRNELGIADGVPLIGTVGMLRRMKGHEYFLCAAAKVAGQRPDARFVIVGDTAFNSNIKAVLTAQMADLGITDKVTMIGYRDDIPDVMAGLDVFVLASIMHEGVPQVVSQALAMERPVVATDVGSIREQVVNGETGLLVEKESVEPLASAILSLLNDSEFAAHLGKAGRGLVCKKFSMESMLDSTERLYADLIGSGE
jgi:glycosyltransferase involved in cell wall biosynthesis